jgi:3'-5' exoribonuclease
MTRRYMRDLTDGDAVDEIFLVAEKQLRANRQGNQYLLFDLRDKTGVMQARLWNPPEQISKRFSPGEFIHVRGKVQLFQGALQMILNHIAVPEIQHFELPEFLPHTEQDIGKLLERLRSFLRKTTNYHLRALGEAYLMDDEFVRGFSRAPAGVRQHHAYIGGLLEHVVSMMEVADRILLSSPKLYPDLDRDLLIFGIFLHDSGKVRELCYESSFSYSDEGQLLGHIQIGVTMLEEKAKQVKELTGEEFPREALLRLQHMILSHHGTYEFGSPKLPMTLEAMALHYIDNLDARMNSWSRDLREDRTENNWTAFNPSTDRRLFKGLKSAGNQDTEA